MIVGLSPTPVGFTRRACRPFAQRALSGRPQRIHADRAVEPASKSSARNSAGMRSCYGVIHTDAPDTITVQKRISFFDAGSIQCSQSPAKARIDEPSAAPHGWLPISLTDLQHFESASF